MLSFPSLTVSANAVQPHGALAAAQTVYLQPDAALLRRLEASLQDLQLGVVAHFYMDAELQGLLAHLRWPHVFVADSLAMADAAVRMAQAGVKAVLVLGVDFMAENVRAVLDAQGFAGLPVYRLRREAIGCSLAEAADSPAYRAYLQEAAQTPRTLHVVYINTSLRAKAFAQRTLPTITCTSSNVVRMLLQAYAQVPGLRIGFGPDTFMGRNLATLLHDWATLAEHDLGDATLRSVHPTHDRQSIAAAAARFHAFDQGHCIVHQGFDRDVVERLRDEAADALITAHLEVPGEMFALALAAQRQGRGMVGSTSQILSFIEQAAKSVAAMPATGRPLRIVLGTETGMLTSIVRSVQAALAKGGNAAATVEIILPVASDAVQPTGDASLPLLPGVASGEGCSASGGCATCPYMKMNSVRALFELLDLLATPGAAGPAALSAYAPPMGQGSGENPSDLVAEGSEPILAMRYFQQHGRLPEGLVQRLIN